MSMSLHSKRKQVMKEAQWEDHQLPGRNQYIVKVLRSTGNNLHMVQKPCGEVHHVSMPTKFRRNIWIKRGNYVLVEPIPEGKKVKGEIVKIFDKDSIKFYTDNNIWPEEFVDRKTVEEKANDDDVFENTNRNRVQNYSESSEEEFEDKTNSAVKDKDIDLLEFIKRNNYIHDYGYCSENSSDS